MLGDIFNMHTVAGAAVVAGSLITATPFPPAVNASAALVSFVPVNDDEMLTDARL
jgi:hypothetical protein